MLLRFSGALLAQQIPSGMQPLEVDWTPALYAAPALLLFLVLLLRWRFKAEASLCAGCRHNSPQACRKPERPEARSCSDFEAA